MSNEAIDRTAAITNWRAGYRNIYTTNRDPRSKHDGGKQYLMSVSGGWTDATAEEIVKLAAAAPELLEVIEDFYETALAGGGRDELETCWPDLAPVYDKARAAIAKATAE